MSNIKKNRKWQYICYQYLINSNSEKDIFHLFFIWFFSNRLLHKPHVFPLNIKRVYLPFVNVADTPFHIQGASYELRVALRVLSG